MLVILNTVPVSVKPVPAVYSPEPLNCSQTIGSVPTVVTSSICTQPVELYCVPAVTKVKSPPAISTAVSKSIARVSVVPFVYV